MTTINSSLSQMWLLSALYAWAVSAFVAMGLGGRYGRDQVAWGLAAVFAGPLAIAILYFCGPVRASDRFGLDRDDTNRWQAWIRMDPEVASAADVARRIGPRCEADLAQLFLTIGDRRCIKAALAKAQEAAGNRIARKSN